MKSVLTETQENPPRTPAKQMPPEATPSPSPRSLAAHASEPLDEVNVEATGQQYLVCALEDTVADAARPDSDGDPEDVSKENISRRNRAEMEKCQMEVKASRAGLGLKAVRQMKAGVEMAARGPLFQTYAAAVQFCIDSGKAHWKDRLVRVHGPNSEEKFLVLTGLAGFINHYEGSLGCLTPCF